MRHRNLHNIYFSELIFSSNELAIQNSMGTIVSYFDQEPEFNGKKIRIRGSDGYFNGSDMANAIGMRFRDWTRNKRTKQVLAALSRRLEMPERVDIDPRADLRGGSRALIEYTIGDNDGIWMSSYAALAFAMADPEFEAEVIIWMHDLMRLGTVNPHYLKWTKEEYYRGMQFNRDDIDEMYSRDR